MSKIRNDALFLLIKRLSKSEKWKYTVYANRLGAANKKYLILFSAIAKQSKYDEERLMEIKEILKTQLPNLKANLYKQLLSYLSQGSSNIPSTKTNEQIQQIKYLYSKCLYDDCFVLIDKGKGSASKNYQLLAMLELLVIEKMCLLHSKDRDFIQRIDDVVKNIEDISLQLRHIHLLSNLAIKLNALYQSIGFVRNSADILKIKEYFNQHSPKLNQLGLSVIEKVHYFLTTTGYYLFIQDFKNAYKNAKLLLALFESNTSLIESRTELYIKAINYVLVCENKLYLYPFFVQTQKKLQSLKRNKALICNENLALNLFKSIYIHEINKHFMSGEFRQGIKIVNALEIELDKFVLLLNKNTVLLLYYKIACLYIGAEQYRLALTWVNKLINEKTYELREDLKSFVRILELICYFELGDEAMVEYKVRSTYRYLASKEGYSKYQQYIIKFLVSMNKVLTKKELYKKFVDLSVQMKSIEKFQSEKRSFMYFDIISWLESKIEKRNLQDIVIDKFKNKLLKVEQ